MSDKAYTEAGEQWFADEGEFAEQLKAYWGNWGCASEVGPLRAVLMRRPGAEIEHVTDAKAWRWLDVMDPGKACAQADHLASHIVIIDHGKVIALGSPKALIASLGGQEVVELACDSVLDPAALAALPGVSGVHRAAGEWSGRIGRRADRVHGGAGGPSAGSIAE